MILTDTDNKLMVTKEGRGQERNKLAVWDEQKQTMTYKTDKQRGPAVEQGRYTQCAWPVSVNTLLPEHSTACLPVAALCCIIRVAQL